MTANRWQLLIATVLLGSILGIACASTGTGAAGTPQPAHPIAIACEHPVSYQVGDDGAAILHCNTQPYTLTWQYGEWER